MGTLEIFFIFIIYCSNKAAQGDLCQTDMVQENTSTFFMSCWYSISISIWQI